MGVAHKENKLPAIKTSRYQDPLERPLHNPMKRPFYDPLKRPFYDPFKKPFRDPFKNPFQSYKPRHVGSQFQYRPYVPTHVGIYGEKQHPRKLTYPKQPRKFVKKPREPVVTYKCYRRPMGPDIRLGDTGPEYPVKQYVPWKSKSTGNVHPNHTKQPYKDPLKNHTVNDPFKQKVEPKHGYKLTERNYLPFRNWKVGDITDTIALGPGESKPNPQPKPKLERRAYESSSIQYQSLVKRNTPTHTGVRSPTSTTQTTPLPITKIDSKQQPQISTGTQYTPTWTRPVYMHPTKAQTPGQLSPTTSQTKYQTPSPMMRTYSPRPIVPVIIPSSMSKPPTKSIDDAVQETAPVVQRSPYPNQTAYTESVQTTAQTPLMQANSPRQIVPVVIPLTASEPSTKFIEDAAVAKQQPPSYSGYSYKLPPEVNANIQAYSDAHMDEMFEQIVDGRTMDN